MQTRKCVNFQLELYAIAATCKKNLFAHDAKELKFRAWMFVLHAREWKQPSCFKEEEVAFIVGGRLYVKWGKGEYKVGGL